MSLANEYNRWLQRGRQRAAIARVLRKPMTAAEICAVARKFTPQIQLRDVWFLMRQFEKQKLAVCLNPQQVTGKLYCLTETGRRATRQAFGITHSVPPADVDWRKYSWVIRAKIRRQTLCSLGQLETKAPQTATEIRNHVRNIYSAGLNPVLRSVRELADRKLIACVGVTPGQACKLYRTTSTGRKILNQLNR
jgi:hypothetical protein